MSRIVWLASYPKSGNTWLRIFLTNFQRDNGRPADINALDFGTDASDRHLFDCALGLESSDLTEAEIDCYRPEAFKRMAARNDGILYLKTHDACLTSAGEPLIPADVTAGAIYVARNPLDVAISFAHHLNKTVEETIERLASESMTLDGGRARLGAKLKQRLLSWSGHVLSWLDQRSIPVHVMRYEDMSLRPIETFTAAVRFLGWDENAGRVRRAVEFSSFEALRGQEQDGGFKERAPGAASFFRHGRVDAWREILTPEQAAKIVSDHGPAMRRLGYLPEDGQHDNNHFEFDRQRAR